MDTRIFYAGSPACRARRSILINGTGIALFLFSVLGLEAAAGFLPWTHDAFVRSAYFRVANSVVFWATAMTSIPLCALALRRSGQVEVAGGNMRRTCVALARLEAATWTAIWITFIGTFWPAITCGLHIYGFPSPIFWPHNTWLWWRSAHSGFEHWLAGHLPRG